MAAISGIHHVTAIASDPQANLDFYAGVLGLRLVKQTVNFDDPGTYHLYFGDEVGRPGTVMTFFPWPGAKRGRHGVGQTAATAFAVPVGSLYGWAQRLHERGVRFSEPITRFRQGLMAIEDRDGTRIELVETPGSESWGWWPGGGVDQAMAIRGFHSVSLSVEGHELTSALLTGTFGMRLEGQDGNRFRYAFTGAGDVPPQVIDVLCMPDASPGKLGAGIVHHVALRAANDTEHVAWQRALGVAGHNVTPVLDRNYFQSIYFREPGGVLLELATDSPGFAVDEAADSLGTRLMLPPQYEPKRAVIEAHVPRIVVPRGS